MKFTKENRKEIKQIRQLLKIVKKFEDNDIDYIYPSTIINSFNFSHKQLVKFLKAYLKAQIKLKGKEKIIK